jgi:hypothetical protein
MIDPCADESATGAMMLKGTLSLAQVSDEIVVHGLLFEAVKCQGLQSESSHRRVQRSSCGCRGMNGLTIKARSDLSSALFCRQD